MRHYYYTILVLFLAQGLFAQNQRLKIDGHLEADSLRARSISRIGGNNRQLLLANGSVATAGTNVLISNGQISVQTPTDFVSTTFVQTALNGKLNLIDTSRWVRTSGNQSIRGLKSFSNVGTRLGGIPFGVGSKVNYTSTEISNNLQNIAIGISTMTNLANEALASAKELENVGLGNQVMQFLGGRGRTNRLPSTYSGISFRNLAIGNRSLMDLANGNENVAIGYNSGSLVVGEGNTVVGANAFKADSSNYNVVIGREALSNTGFKGNFNVIIGNQAGANHTGGDYNTVIGAGQNVPTLGNSNQLNIAGVIYGRGVGMEGVNPRVGILKSVPEYTLDVGGDVAFSGRLLAGESLSTGSLGQVLTSAGPGAGATWTTLPNLNKTRFIASSARDSLRVISSSTVDSLRLAFASVGTRAGLMANTAQEFAGTKTMRLPSLRPNWGSGINWLRASTGANFDWQMSPDLDTSINKFLNTRIFTIKYTSPLNSQEIYGFKFYNNGDLELPRNTIAKGYLFSNGDLTVLGTANVGGMVNAVGNMSATKSVIAGRNLLGDSLIAAKSLLAGKNVRSDTLMAAGVRNNATIIKQLEVSNVYFPAAFYMKGINGTFVGLEYHREKAAQWFVGIPGGNNHLTFNSGTLFNFIGINNEAPTKRVDVGGHIRASLTVLTGSTVLTSDIRLKRNIKPMQQGLALVEQLKSVEYDKKEDMADMPYSQHEYGFIAQDVQKVLPTLVIEGNDPNKLLHLNYTAFIPLLTKALQEQEARIKEQKIKIRALLNRLEALEKKL